MISRFSSLSDTAKGVSASVIASCLFGLLPLYVQFQPELEAFKVAGGEGHWIAAQRVIWSVFVVLIFLTISGRIGLLFNALKQMNRWHRYLLSALLVGPNIGSSFGLRCTEKLCRSL